MAREMPELTPFFATGSLVDAVVSMGAPAPIDVQIVGANLEADNTVAQDIAAVLKIQDVADKLIKQGSFPVSTTPEQLDTINKNDTERYLKLLKDAGIQPQ